ncbi:L-serine ammonia-lyase [Sulfurospirillum arcachonense]|uniref:L-serine ammonia-lyase n=1 Tax=Sulfurospirillum arcachonense TaxID=57666 RepID=UPI001FDF9A21|nr:L-serine ammonia-lyase [Sulfurospirillum arcachonense]
MFEIFKIGIGPSSSHTVGPMKIAQAFVNIAQDKDVLQDTHKIKIELFGSLGATGIGHSSDKAVVLGLIGMNPENINMKIAKVRFEEVLEHKKINLLEIKRVDFDFTKDLVLYANKFLDFHSNGIKLHFFDKNGKVLLSKTYYSIGGGAILDEEDIGKSENEESVTLPYSFNSADELLMKCRENSLSISTLMMENEKSIRSEEEVKEKLLEIWKVMEECIKIGCETTGVLPKMGVRKRANEIFNRLKSKDGFSMIDPLEVMDWINLWALAVNEENACGGKIVTAPTNGAAGVIPSVIQYMNRFLGNSLKEYDEDKIVKFLLTAGAIGILYQKNASISGADVGCQGEVGVACSMAAGALAEAMGGSIEQVENAAEIGMEHNLGLTCDPVGGLVQIPCIERNAMAAMKAVNAARMALNGDGKHFVSLDNVIKTMFETGKDMMNKYKETSQGGLAVNIVEC